MFVCVRVCRNRGYVACGRRRQVGSSSTASDWRQNAPHCTNSPCVEQSLQRRRRRRTGTTYVVIVVQRARSADHEVPAVGHVDSGDHQGDRATPMAEERRTGRSA